MEGGAQELLAATERELRTLELAVTLAHWEASTTGTPEALEKATDAERRLRLYLSSPERYERIVALLESGRVDDPRTGQRDPVHRCGPRINGFIEGESAL